LAFGGLAPFTLQAKETQAFLVGKQWNQDTFEKAVDVLRKEVTLKEGTPGGMEKYRTTLALSFFFKYYLAVAQKMVCAPLPPPQRALWRSRHVALPNPRRKTAQSSRRRTCRLCGRSPLSPPRASKCLPEAISPSWVRLSLRVPGVCRAFDRSTHSRLVVVFLSGQSIVHASAERQVTGEAVYIDDMPRLQGELNGSLVVSQRPHAKLRKVDASKALQVPGVIGFFSHKDIPGEKIIGDIVHDEEVFASEVVETVGQPIGTPPCRGGTWWCD
jgi:xanthine dehydrogenase/oxidase